MNGKLLKEIEEIIYTVCTLCRDHEKAGLIEDIKVGMRLKTELTNIYGKQRGSPSGLPLCCKPNYG